jgi:hypothetical protein
MSKASNLVPVTLSNGSQVLVEMTSMGGDEDVAFSATPFDDVVAALDEVSTNFVKSFRRARPSKATVEFGCEVGLESGKLTAILVKGSAKANFKITLEWGTSGPEASTDA